ncbi:MAG: DUF6457 domain-containing protein [Actinomycetota bacterium]|nr:DUF6457 domain-containing protein [Actinomycetota bacterium]MDQ6948714.1 DUF6457 domain-containing protein [Actinomycetota bacterium]
MSERSGDEEPDWPRRYAAALGADLADADVEVLLDLAREVAHGSERRFAPLSTFVAGRFVALRMAAGVSASDALAEAVAVARSLLAGESET